MKRIEIPKIERKDNNSITRECTIKKVSRIADLYKRSEVSVLWYKYQNNIEFTKDDLITLYDIYNENYMLNENEKGFMHLMCNGRKKLINFDMAKIFECDPLEVARSQEDLKKDPDRYVVLQDVLNISKDDNIYKNLKYIKNSLHSFDSMAVINNFPSLLSVGGFVYLPYLEDASSLISLKSIGGDANFEKLNNAYGLNNLEIIGQSAFFKSLKSIKELESLRYIGNNMYFDNCKDLEELKRRVKRK